MIELAACGRHETIKAVVDNIIEIIDNVLG
jgi:hypothetical protein